ncbi:MAG TPA: glutamate-cysteine ligase family protein [Myxococcota bacterium]|nr:glutamate-cysteine ligase family protein [Myxococcota bacterium]
MDSPLSLFEAYGIELEYMIVDAETLDVRPIADRLIEAEHGAIENEIERGAFAWSNELARHVVEIKTNGPAAQLAGLARGFAGEIARIEGLLAPLGARLLPGGMHPWMDPAREFELWPHGDREIYAAFDRIFDCRGHGWANLQSAHLNLPFASDDQFGRLHAAARALLPLLPALAAASPFVEGRHQGQLDARLDVYRHNAGRVRSVAGAVVPEPIFAIADYRALLASLYADLAPLDPDRTLCHEWVNARGCIARFDRMALEIRVLDVQECPHADLAIAWAVARTLRALCDPAPAHQARLRALATPPLADLLERTTAHAERAGIEDADLLRALGLDGAPRTAQEVWRALFDRHLARDGGGAEHRPALEVVLEEGCLARRILRRVGEKPEREALAALYRELGDCLREGRLLRGDP